ncbi:RHS repeat-associated core domain-containing protein [Trinickia sp. NRRL B-1857]|uniref:RHS repeat-associated core domain-containing protein n=1 Tax=Trinickia sp. NRRL B-1857 TaxID=3162879 RepID=UPI003D2D2554
MTILKASESHSSSTQNLMQSSFQYYTDKANLGRPKTSTHVHYSDDDPQKSYTATQSYEYQPDSDLPGALKYSSTMTANDGLSRTATGSHSVWTGRVWQTVDAKGNATSYKYDGLGRVIEKTLAPNTPYACTTAYNYALSDGGTESLLITIRTTSSSVVNGVTVVGNTTRCGLDALGRLLYGETSDVDNGVTEPSHDHQRAVVSYDELGRTKQRTNNDWLPNFSQAYSSVETSSYDDWGQQNRLDTDGRYVSSSYDPIARQRTVGRGSGTGAIQTALTVTTYDAGGLPIKIARYATGDDPSSAQPYSTRSMEYDGLHRLRKLTDERGHTTSYDYDDWGRVVKTTLPATTNEVTQQTMPVAVVTRKYRPDSGSKDVTQILVNGCLSGTQQFDGLGRVVYKTVGCEAIASAIADKNVWSYTYDKPEDTQASQITPPHDKGTAPETVALQFAYRRELGDTLISLSASDGSHTFSYDSVTGFPTEAAAASTQIQSTPYPSGRMQSQAITLDGNQTCTGWIYTVDGAPYQYTHVDKKTTTIERYPDGRAQTIKDDDMSVTLTYDAVGRLTDWVAADATNSHQLHTHITPDDYGREISRVITDLITDKGTQVWKLTQTWNEADQLTRRTTGYYDNATYRDETYGYDERNRLVSWTCTAVDGAYPKDRYNNELQSQKFVFDAQNNITNVVTAFAKGGSNTAVFTYACATDPCRLTSFTNTHSSYPASGKPSYDAAGRMTDDGMTLSFVYDMQGRIQAAQDSKTNRKATYAYDAYSRRYKHVRDDQSDATTYFYYLADRLVNVVQGENAVRMLWSAAGCTSQSISGANSGVWLTSADHAGSVLGASNGTAKPEQFGYSPYGERSAAESATVLGYDGEYRDEVIQGYLLGNGYRAYLPSLMRFTSQDNMSPFLAGGINPYAYCSGDPINYSDPTGHFNIFHIFKKVLHGAGDYFSHAIKGGALSLVLYPLGLDKYNPVIYLKHWVGEGIQDFMNWKGAKFSGAYWALKGIGWAQGKFENGLLENDLHISASWANVISTTTLSVATLGAGELLGAVSKFAAGAFSEAEEAGIEFEEFPQDPSTLNDGIDAEAQEAERVRQAAWREVARRNAGQAELDPTPEQASMNARTGAIRSGIDVARSGVNTLMRRFSAEMANTEDDGVSLAWWREESILYRVRIGFLLAGTYVGRTASRLVDWIAVR